MIQACVKSKMLMKIILTSISLVGLLSSQCIAAEYGLGISVKDRDPTIYIPINITNAFRTELSLSYSSYERERTSWTSESDTYQFGIGLFALKNIYDKTQMYYGSRFSYTDGKSESTGGIPPSSSSDYSSYTISPTLGIEYFLTDHVALGGEIEFYYIDSSQDYDNSLSSDIDTTSTGTDTHVMLRYYF